MLRQRQQPMLPAARPRTDGASSAFLEDMPKQFATSDLVLARSGASTVAELAASGKPSLLVPFPQAADDHQRKNAEVLVEGGAAKMLLEQKMTGPRLLDDLTGLLTHPQQLSDNGNPCPNLCPSPSRRKNRRNGSRPGLPLLVP